MTKPPTDAVEMLEYDSETETYRIAFDATTTTPSMAVVSALESLVDGEFEHDTPLYEAIDPESLDRILSSPSSDETAGHRSVRFRYHGFRVTVNSRGYLELHRRCDAGQGASSG